MDLVPARDENTDNLLQDLGTNAAPTPDLTPLVGNLLVPNTSAPLTDWPLSNLYRNELRYEYSLTPSADFDTDSAEPNASSSHSPTIDDDDASTDLRGAATSEETSLPFDNHSRHQVPHVTSSSQLNAKNIAMQRLCSVNSTANCNTSSNPVSSHPQFPVSTTLQQQSISPKPSKTIKKRSTVPRKHSRPVVTNPSASASALTSNAQTVGLSHTKMCRDRLNSMFERLKRTLPPAPSGVEVKHKAQVLDYAILVLKGMVERTTQLEIELAVSSNKATMEWISKLVDRVDTFPNAAEEVMQLFSRRRGWKHAELWTTSRKTASPEVDSENSVTLRFCSSICSETTNERKLNLQTFSKASEKYAFKAQHGVPGRVWSSMRPEWVTGLDNSKNFHRSSLAKKHGLKVCLAVPVTITGKIEAVMCFYDTKHRPYDTQCLELAMNLAWALGNAVGGKRAKGNAGANSGISCT